MSDPSAHEESAAKPRRGRRTWLALAVVVAIGLAVVAAALGFRDSGSASAPRPPASTPSPPASTPAPPASTPAPPASTPRPADDGGYLRGVNSYSLAYIAGSDPRYRSEPPSSYRYLASRGHKIIRLPIPWGKLQPQLGGPLDPNFQAAMLREVANIRAAGMRTVLDLHAYFRHPTSESAAVVGDGISQAQLDDVWLKLSALFKDDESVYAYDLMNEPYDMPSSVIEEASQGMVTALREAGDDKLLWIEGNNYSLTRSWRRNHPRPWISDPARNFVYSAHYYVGGVGNDNRDYPGTIDGDPVEQALADLEVFTDWLEEYDERGSIGEVGWPSARSNASWKQWNDLHERWYQAADAAGLDVTYFGASSAYDEHLFAYDAPENSFDPVPGISQAESQASVIERHPSTGPGSGG